MILETPAPEPEIWAEEIKLLYWMIGKTADDPELLEREKILQEKGREDREKQLDVLKRKAEKAAKTPRKRKTQTLKNGEVSASSGGESDGDSGSEM
jgi:AP endonuclease 1